jgi:hypothetical protein
MEANQYSLRRLFLLVAVVAALIGAYLGYARMLGNAHRDAVRKAIRAGRIDGEAYRRWFTAEEFEQLHAEASKNSGEPQQPAEAR